MKNKVEISVVVPMYNESSGLDLFFHRTLTVLDTLCVTYEIICVNDGSQDDTLHRLIKIHEQNPKIKVINLSRNFGKEAALTAGIDYSCGEAVIPIDADLQDPPEVIPSLIEKWRQGFQVVYATRKARVGETWLKRWTANIFYQLLARLTNISIPINTGDFRLMDRRAVDALMQLREKNRFMKGLFASVGFTATSVLYDREPRHAGTTTWNYWKLWNLAVNGITAFSNVPLQIITFIGIIIALLSFLYAAFLVFRTVFHGIDVPGYASLMVVVLFIGGLQLISLGVIGEYLGRVYNETKSRPIYIVQDEYGIQDKGQ